MRYLLFAFVLVPALVVSVAFAADFAPIAPPPPEGVVIPWGDWASAVLVSMGVTVPGLVAYGLQKLGPVGAAARAVRLNLAIENAVKTAINRKAGAIRGETVTLNTGLDIANDGLRILVQQVPGLVKGLGVDQLWLRMLGEVPFAKDVEVPADAQPRDRSWLERALKRFSF